MVGFADLMWELNKKSLNKSYEEYEFFFLTKLSKAQQ